MFTVKRNETNAFGKMKFIPKFDRKRGVQRRHSANDISSPFTSDTEKSRRRQRLMKRKEEGKAKREKRVGNQGSSEPFKAPEVPTVVAIRSFDSSYIEQHQVEPEEDDLRGYLQQVDPLRYNKRNLDDEELQRSVGSLSFQREEWSNGKEEDTMRPSLYREYRGRDGEEETQSETSILSLDSSDDEDYSSERLGQRLSKHVADSKNRIASRLSETLGKLSHSPALKIKSPASKIKRDPKTENSKLLYEAFWDSCNWDEDRQLTKEELKAFKEFRKR